MLGRTLGPFGNSRAVYDAADKAGLKVGITLEELEAYMTRERKILKGHWGKGEMEPVIDRAGRAVRGVRRA